MMLFVIHLVIIFLLGLCIGLLIGLKCRCRKIGGSRSRAGRKIDRPKLDSCRTSRGVDMDDPFLMKPTESPRKQVFTAVEVERPFNTVEKCTQSGTSEHEELRLSPKMPPPPPATPSKPKPKGPYETTEPSLWDTPLVPTQRLSAARQVPVEKPPQNPRNKVQEHHVKSVFAEGAMRDAKTPNIKESKMKAEFSYKIP
ncbi:hypothetical protein GCK32_022702 [Trichostrongylus colubriformis]|uniref:Uncharacterized protein n=1 Tax=Trichostrongylus colubriformis TaxID=6319 RepID=A0AAN8FBK5_TRICO